MKGFIAAILLLLSFAQLANSALSGTGTQQFCPISPTRTYLDISAHPESGQLEAYLYTIDNGVRKPVDGGLLYKVETKGSQGISSITACYMSTGANGKSSFQYDPAFSGCYNSWFVYCPNGATALSTSEAGKTVRQMCLNGTGIDQAKIDGNQISYCSSTGAPSDKREHILSHNEFAFCNYSPAGFEQLCWPLLLILGLLLSASFAVGKNPFAAFDLSAPRMGRGRQYTMRQQQRSFEYMSYAMGSHAAFETAGKVRDEFREKETKFIKDGSGKYVKNSKGDWVKDGTGKYVRVEELKHGKPSNWGEYAPLSLIGKGVNAVIGKPISSLLRRDASDLERLRKEHQEKEAKKGKTDEKKKTQENMSNFVKKAGPPSTGKMESSGKKEGPKKDEQKMRLQSTAQNIQYMAGDIYRGFESIFGISSRGGIYLQPMSKEGQEAANYYGSLGFGGTMGAIWDRVEKNFTVSNMIIAAFQSNIGKKFGIATQIQLAYYVIRPDMLPIGLSVLSESLASIRASVETRTQIQKLLDQLSTGIAGIDGYEGRKGEDGRLIFTAKDGTYIIVDPNTMEFAMYRMEEGTGWQVRNAAGQWEALEDTSKLNGLVGVSGKVEISTMALEKLMKDETKAAYLQLDLQKGEAKLLLNKEQYVDLLEKKSDYESTLAKFQESVVLSGWQPSSAWDRANWRNGIAVANGLEGIEKAAKELAEDISKLKGKEKQAYVEANNDLIEFCKELGLDNLASHIGKGNKNGIEKSIELLLEKVGDKEFLEARQKGAEQKYVQQLIKDGEVGSKLDEAKDLYELGKKSAEYSQNMALNSAMQMQAEARRKLIEATEKGNQEAISSASLELQVAKDFVNASYSEKLYTGAENKIGEIIGDYKELDKKEKEEYRNEIKDEVKSLTGSEEIDVWIASKQLELKLKKGDLAQDDLTDYANAIELKMKLDICKSIDENKGDMDKSAVKYGEDLHTASRFFESRAELAYLPISTQLWGSINQMDPTSEASVNALRTIAGVTYDTNGLKDWYGPDKKAAETIGTFEELQHRVQENAVNDPVMVMLWEKCTERIRDAQNGEITPEEKNEAGIKAMKEAIGGFEQELKQPGAYIETYVKSLENEITRLKNGIDNAGYDREWKARAEEMLAQLEESKTHIMDSSANWDDGQKQEFMRLENDPLSKAKTINNSLYYVSEKFKEQQMYENRDALRAPHYLTDVDELKENIQSGAMRDESIKQTLQQLKDREWIEKMKTIRDDLDEQLKLRSITDKVQSLPDDPKYKKKKQDDDLGTHY